jgi:NADH-quinone oxidoreductase subunit N
MLASVLKTGTYTWLVIAGVLFAAISVYYYFRLIQAMYFKEGNSAVTEEISSSFKTGVILLAALIILIGIFPSLILNWLYF